LHLNDFERLGTAELGGDWTRKEKPEQAPALHIEFYIKLIIARNKEKSIRKERISGARSGV
jgi:hypothetical protein